MTTITHTGSGGKMTEREYFGILNDVVDELMEAWPGTHAELAEASRCSRSTIYKLAEYVTRKPQLRTVLRLAKAVGVKLVFDFSVRRKSGAVAKVSVVA